MVTVLGNTGLTPLANLFEVKGEPRILCSTPNWMQTASGEVLYFQSYIYMNFSLYSSGDRKPTFLAEHNFLRSFLLK